MRTPDFLWQRRARRRRRFGLRKIHIEISQEGIELLEKRGYLLGANSDASIGAGRDGAVIGPGPGRGMTRDRQASDRVSTPPPP
jgi:hypothetical protein